MVGVVLFLVLLLSAWGYGRLAGKLIFRNWDLPAWRRLLFELAIGLGVTAHLTLILGALLGVHLTLGVLILAVGAGLGIFSLVKNRKPALAGWHRFWENRPWRSLDAVCVIFALLILAYLMYILLSSVVLPPVSYDEIAYHLAIPQTYIREGQISYISYIPYANWPLEAEMLFLLPLLFGSERAAHLVTWGFMVLTSLSLVLEGRRIFSLRTGMVAAFAFTATGMVFTLSGTALIEVPLTLYSYFAVIAFLDWLKDSNRPALAASAVFAGLAASIKFNAVMLPVILGVLLLIVHLQRSRDVLSSIKSFARYGLISFGVVAPWYLKSWIQTGNPIWGFFMNIFPTRNWDETGQQILMTFIQSPNFELTPLNFFKVFWTLSATPDAIGPFGFRLGWAYLAMLPFGLAALLWLKSKDQRSSLGWLSLLALVLYTNWFFQTHQARFMMPVLPVLALVGAAGVDWLSRSLPKIGSWALLGLVAGAIIANSWMVNPGERSLANDGIRYLTGQVSREDYLVSRLPGIETFFYANQQLPENAFVWLALYEGRGYYLDRRYEWANLISQRVTRFEVFADASQLAAYLRSRGFSHILFRTGQPERFRSSVLYGDHAADLVYNLLQEEARLLYRSANPGETVELYELLPER